MVRRLVGLFAAASLVAGTADAQRRGSPSVAHVQPYIGYMSFGSYVDGPLGTRLGNAGAPIYGAQLGIDLTESIAFVGNVGYSSSKLEAGVPIFGGIDLADSKVLLYDAGLQLKMPESISLGTGAVPFVQAGAGAMRTEIGLGSLEAKSTNFAFNYGAGLELALGKGMGVRLMAKDYVGKFDVQEATRINIQGKTTHNWAYSVGMKLGF
jgi:opacity protein-like surface antigen